MKKKLAVKLASVLSLATIAIAEAYKLPESFVFWGEPKLPLEKEEK